LIGSCGRTDEPGSDSAQLFDSVMGRLFSFPDETLVYPGHAMNGRRVSSIGEERESNPHFHGVSRAAFAALGNDDGLPGILPIALEANRYCGRLILVQAA
jgi:glyoxylase-like metal-dependent hydrolase (beta-lactamase superfamily II)